MGANLFTTVSIAVALEGSAGKAASAAGRKIAGGAKKVLPKAAAKVERKLLNGRTTSNSTEGLVTGSKIARF